MWELIRQHCGQVLGVAGTLAGVWLGNWLARRSRRQDAKGERQRRDAEEVLDLVVDYHSNRWDWRLKVGPAPPPGGLAVSMWNALEPPQRKRARAIVDRGRLPGNVGRLVEAYFEAAKQEGRIESPWQVKTEGDDAEHGDAFRQFLDVSEKLQSAFQELREALRDVVR